MRLLSVRLIVSLILGITLVSAGFSYYEVLREKRALRNDLERSAEMLGESLVGNVERLWNGDPEIAPNNVAHKELQRLVQRFGNREHLLGVVIYDRRGALVATTGARKNAHRQSAGGDTGRCAGTRREFVRPAGKFADTHSRTADSRSG